MKFTANIKFTEQVTEKQEDLSSIKVMLRQLLVSLSETNPSLVDEVVSQVATTDKPLAIA